MENCFICKNPVLGLTGQDDLLSPVFCSTEDAELLSRKIYGECHSNCLINSGWADRWANLRVDSLVGFRRCQLFELDNARICISPIGSSAFVHLRESHHCIAIEARMLDLTSNCDSSVFVEHEVNWECSEYLTECDGKRSAQLKEFPLSLKLIADLLGIQALYSDSVLSNGFLAATNRTIADLQFGYLSGSCRYPLELPEPVLQFLINSRVA